MSFDKSYLQEGLSLHFYIFWQYKCVWPDAQLGVHQCSSAVHVAISTQNVALDNQFAEKKHDLFPCFFLNLVQHHLVTILSCPASSLSWPACLSKGVCILSSLIVICLLHGRYPYSFCSDVCFFWVFFKLPQFSPYVFFQIKSYSLWRTDSTESALK